MEFAVPSTDAGEVVVLELPVRDPSFDLEKAVCSHGLFMMAPNHWDPASRTLQRPLRLSSSSGAAATVRVRISHPSISGPILVSVAGAASFTSDEEQSLLAQVRRMMRISDENDRLIGEFHKVHADCRESGFGRIFRSPTLFEDMVKCILLCNCQWPRTLSMARALCELRLEVKHSSSPEGFHPNTPQPREKKRKHKERNKVSKKLETKFVENIAELSDIPDSELNRNCQPLDACNSSNSSHRVNHEVRDFPTPEELAALDPVFLANRCKLGYRAERIASLARSIVNGKLQLKHLEEPYDGFSASSYDLLDEKLSSFSGFGPFTRANVLMCMGFYQRVPVDSETIRHIRLVCTSFLLLYYFTIFSIKYSS
ncbi:hypothetical protein AXF42_Ash018869 [Apostasia shenzhenica]|uniref:HhH-GPD domain-containing protein n=1 Tax=Apostasia shenzhenica TaxID=1088818 RepID=A0A2I0B505_9ASPA|nr:hypothetical protein AXF42_Ash018869 [Apostasia shenzhenica]